MTVGEDPQFEPLRVRRHGKRRRWRLRSWFLAVGAAAVLVLCALGAGAFTLAEVFGARDRLVERIDPALLRATELSSALLNQETGASGYALTGRRDFLEPYPAGVRAQREVDGVLDGLIAGELAGVRPEYQRVRDLAGQWQREDAEPMISAIQAGGSAGPEQIERGKARFEQVKAALGDLRLRLEAERRAANDSLDSLATTLVVECIGIATLLVALLAALYVGLRTAVVQPVLRLAASVRAAAEGEMTTQVRGSGPREIIELGEDVDAMRQHIVDEYTALQTALQELERSNSDLEQFAYVASHDLQEPLRKVASFCELLQRRYGGQLDDRADQYIGFAVDGAKRMQVLINDLLAFSRVGRRAGEQVRIEGAALLERATANLTTAIEDSGAQVTSDELPVVRGEASLLTAVFQNLIGNAIKFRGESAPRVHVGVERTGGLWTFSVSDEGIGIDPEYAERIFVIFQRLHPKDAYPGTGIGLAMCRKIIEYHGGTIWLDTTVTSGTRFCFTLPVVEDSEEE